MFPSHHSAMKHVTFSCKNVQKTENFFFKVTVRIKHLSSIRRGEWVLPRVATTGPTLSTGARRSQQCQNDAALAHSHSSSCYLYTCDFYLFPTMSTFIMLSVSLFSFFGRLYWVVWECFWFRAAAIVGHQNSTYFKKSLLYRFWICSRQDCKTKCQIGLHPEEGTRTHNLSWFLRSHSDSTFKRENVKCVPAHK